MSGLLKADLRRVLKDKLLLVMGILAVAFAVVNPLIYAAMFSDSDLIAGAGLLDMESIVSAKSQFFASFGMGQNVGLIAPVFLAIVLHKDFSHGTVRNKIIAGKSRSAIFMSLFTTCAIVVIVVMLLHAFLTLGISSIFFDYQSAPFTIQDFWYLLESLGFDILMLLFLAAMLSWLSATAKNVGIVIVLYIAISFIMVMIGTVIHTAIPILEYTSDNEKLISVLRVLDRINVGNSTAYIGTGTAYTTEDVLYLTIPALTGIFAFIGRGLWKFNKKDLK